MKKLFRIAKISSEVFILLFGIWTIASNLAVIFQIPFSYLGLIYILLFLVFIAVLIRTGFFNDWKTKISDESFNNKNSNLQLFAFITLVVMLFIVVLYTGKPCTDDAHYIRTSVDMVDHPDKAVLLYDALGLFKNAPLFITVYKAHAIESFCAQVSVLTGIPVIYIFHYLLPVLGIFISAMVYLMLFRKILPGKFILASIISFVLMYVVSLQVFSMNVFTKIHEGKGVLLAAVIPFIILYGLKSSGEHKSRNWFLLGIGQVCAIGMNSTALWLAPVVANLSVIAGSIGQSKKQMLLNVLFGVLSSLYVVAFGLYLAINFDMPPFYLTRNIDAISLLQLSLNRLFDDGIIFYLSVFIILFSWLFAPNRISRAITIIFPAFLVLIFFNPLFIDFIANNIVSERVYWRVAWIIPLQVFLGVIGSSFLFRPQKQWAKYFKLVFVLMLFFTFVFNLPGNKKIASFQNIFKDRIPSLKVAEGYYTSEKINKLLTEKDVLLSPEEISIWISTLHKHPQTLIYRFMVGKRIMSNYLEILYQKKPEDLKKFSNWASWYVPSNYHYPISSDMSDKIKKLRKETGIEELEIFLDYEYKLAMKVYLSGKLSGTDIHEHFTKGLDHYKVTAVCLPVEMNQVTNIKGVLKSSGFKMISQIDEYELWKRSSTIY